VKVYISLPKIELHWVILHIPITRLRSTFNLIERENSAAGDLSQQMADDEHSYKDLSGGPTVGTSLSTHATKSNSTSAQSHHLSDEEQHMSRTTYQRTVEESTASSRSEQIRENIGAGGIVSPDEYRRVLKDLIIGEYEAEAFHWKAHATDFYQALSELSSAQLRVFLLNPKGNGSWQSPSQSDSRKRNKLCGDLAKRTKDAIMVFWRLAGCVRASDLAQSEDCKELVKTPRYIQHIGLEVGTWFHVLTGAKERSVELIIEKGLAPGEVPGFDEARAFQVPPQLAPELVSNPPPQASIGEASDAVTVNGSSVSNPQLMSFAQFLEYSRPMSPPFSQE
jgi:hypothetical protein